MGVWLGCNGGGNVNECWCRPDLQSIATSRLQSCVSRVCTVGGWESDYSSARNVYATYCQGAGLTAIAGTSPATVSAVATAAATGSVAIGAPTVTRVTFATQTADHSSAANANTVRKWLLPASLVLLGFLGSSA